MNDSLAAVLQRVLALQAYLPTVQDIYVPHSPSLEPSRRAVIPELLPFSLHRVFNDLPEGVYSVVTSEDVTRILGILYEWIPGECKPARVFTPVRLMHALTHPALSAWEDYPALQEELEALACRCQQLANAPTAGNCPHCWNPVQVTTRSEGEPGFLECAGCHTTWATQENLNQDRIARIRKHDQPGITITWRQVIGIWDGVYSRKTLEKYRRQGVFHSHQGCFDLAEVNHALTSRI